MGGGDISVSVWQGLMGGSLSAGQGDWSGDICRAARLYLGCLFVGEWVDYQGLKLPTLKTEPQVWGAREETTIHAAISEKVSLGRNK